MEENKENKKEETKKVLYSFLIKRYEDGSTFLDVVQDENNENAISITNEEMSEEVVKLGELIKDKRLQDAAYIGAYNGAKNFFESTLKARATAPAPFVDTDVKNQQ